MTTTLKILERGTWGSIKDRYSHSVGLQLDDDAPVIVAKDIEGDPLMITWGVEDEIKLWLLNGMTYINLDAMMCVDLQELCDEAHKYNLERRDDEED